ncbi:MAG: LTA synthase family protein [Clostridia bacterium]|nr:LTA synthase family protein [Clostridia bacterium]
MVGVIKGAAGKYAGYARDGIWVFVKDILWHYTFLALLFKSVAFIGFLINEGLARPHMTLAYHAIPSVTIYGSFIVTILAFAFFFKGKGHLWFLATVNGIVSVLLMFDLWYYRGFGTLLNLHLLKQVANLQNMSDSILSMARPVDLIFIFDVLIILVIVFFSKNPYKGMSRSIFMFSLLFVACSGYIAYTHYKVDIVEKGQNQILFRICWTPKQTIMNLSPIGYHIYDTYNYWEDNIPLKLSQEETAEIKKWFEDKKENLPDNKYKEMFKGKNLIFLQVESLENFVINQKINGQEITPNLNKLYKNSLYFSNIHEQVYNGTSSDSDLMSNTSVYPVRKGSTFFRYPYNTYNSMPKLMETLGYSTLAIHPDKGAFWNWMEALKSFGFDRLLDSENFVQDEKIGLGLSDGSFLRQVGDEIVKQKQPFYTFMVTLTSHGPFDIEKQYRELKLDEAMDKTKLGGYFQSIHYTDKHIGNLISRLEKDGLMDNTVIVIYGDHCGVHKYYHDELKDITPAEDWWAQKNTEIPLFIYSKQIQGEVIETRGGHVDIMPTVAYLMGVDENVYMDTAMGRNLLKTKKSYAVLADRSFIGDPGNEQYKDEAIKGIDIADKIIRSNYFKGQ